MKDEIIEYVLKNDDIEVHLLNLGATMTHMSLVKDHKNVVLRFKDTNDFIINRGFLGATVGPLAGRTENAEFTLNDTLYTLDQNVPSHHLHGGALGLSKQFMEVIDQSDTSITFYKKVAYTESGYPSDITFEINYSIKGHELTLDMKATPDNETPINLTNHSYFNLNQSPTIEDHFIEVKSNKIVLVSENGSNTDTTLDVVNTVFDLNTAKNIKELLTQDHEQFEITRHIDHTYVLEEYSKITLFEPETKKKLTITSSLPNSQIYLANYFDESLTDEYDRKIKRNCGIAIEPQYIPNATKFDKAVIYSHDKPYHESITYSLDIVD